MGFPVHFQVFAGMRELQYLDLSHNLINSMHEDVFVDIKKIKFLDMSHNKLVQVLRNCAY